MGGGDEEDYLECDRKLSRIKSDDSVKTTNTIGREKPSKQSIYSGFKFKKKIIYYTGEDST